jgi:hypothetical protein
MEILSKVNEMKILEPKMIFYVKITLSFLLLSSLGEKKEFPLTEKIEFNMVLWTVRMLQR